MNCEGLVPLTMTIPPSVCLPAFDQNGKIYSYPQKQLLDAPGPLG